MVPGQGLSVPLTSLGGGEVGVVGAIVIAGEAGRCLAGRPCRGGAAGVVSVVPV